ncbi:MAG: hypothetical protein OXF44_04775 [Anaerolineaceae bacterium]|nr:hypothetical protein [Anaerolineaceae bacterium]
MNAGVILLLTLVLGVMFFLIQRAEKRRRRLVALVMAGLAFLLWYFANFRQLGSEFTASLLLALLLNFLFWLLIGRYNPVGDSDSGIRVLGMDD